MIQPSSGEYHATTDVYQSGRLTWTWNTRLWQPRPWWPTDLDEDSGFAFTEKRARRKADRAARRMMRAADSWVSRTYSAGEAVGERESVVPGPSDTA